jgi:hypothetical protein
MGWLKFSPFSRYPKSKTVFEQKYPYKSQVQFTNTCGIRHF